MGLEGISPFSSLFFFAGISPVLAGISPFFAFFFAFSRFILEQGANNCNLLEKWGISLRPRLHSESCCSPQKEPWGAHSPGALLTAPRFLEHSRDGRLIFINTTSAGRCCHFAVGAFIERCRHSCLPDKPKGPSRTKFTTKSNFTIRSKFATAIVKHYGGHFETTIFKEISSSKSLQIVKNYRQ